MPLNSVSTSLQPGRPFVEQLPIEGVPDGSFPPPLPPPVRTTASTIATAITATTPPAIASTFGSALRPRGPPFEWTGGGAEAAARRACLLFLPLGIGRNSSGLFVAACCCET